MTLTQQDEDDRGLVWEIRAGSRSATQTLLTAYDGMLRAIAHKYRFVSFEDALQEARLSFWLCVQSYDANLGVAFGAYVWRKVHGDVRSRMRRLWTIQGRTAHAREDTESDGFTLWDAALRRAGWAQGHQAAEDVVEWQMIIRGARLSPRETLVMKAWMQGYTTGDIAKQEAVSVETVKTWRKRALQKLRRMLREPEVFDAQQ